MNIFVIVGIVTGLGLLIGAAIIIGGVGQLYLFVDIPSVFVVIGGSTGGILVAYGLSGVMKIMECARFTMFPQKYNIAELIVTMVSFAEKSRREGILSLEDDVNQIQDPFIKKGLQLIVDGTDSELVRKILEAEVEAMMARHDTNKKRFDDWSSLCPSFGMMGTLIGLIILLANLEDKSTIGPTLSVALITTLYGAIASFLVLTPMAINLDSQTSEEVITKTVIIEGLLAIQAGENPRLIKDKLFSYMPVSERESIASEVAE